MRVRGSISLLSFIFLFQSLSLFASEYDGDEGYGGDSYGGYGDSNPYGGGGGGGEGGDYGNQDGGATVTPPKELNSVSEITQFLSEDEDEGAIIGYFDMETNKDDKIIFEEAHRIGKYKYRFGFTTNKDVLKEMKYNGCVLNVHRPAKFVVEKYEKLKSRFPGKTLKSSISLMKWIEDKAIPLVGLKKLSTSGKYDDLPYPQLTLFTEVDLERNMKQFQYYANRLRKIAKDYISKFSFNIADKKDFEPFLTKYGLDSPEKSVGVGIRDGKNYYLMQKDFSTDNVKEFVQSFLAGKLNGKEVHQDFKDEDEENSEDKVVADDGPSDVVTLDEQNFDKLVTKANQDTMIEFYAPWCGHCKQLAPIYEKVAKELKEYESIMIAKYDASSSKPPKQYDVQGFPTLYFVPGDRTKAPMPYDGGRDAKSIVNFIRKHATTPF